MTRFIHAGYDVSGDTEKIVTAYIHGGDGWHRGVALDLGEDATVAASVDVFVTSGDDGYTTYRVHHAGREVDAVEVDGVTYAIYAAVPS